MAVIGLGLSGGVDSTIAAYLLAESGHEVKGFSLRLGSGPDEGYRLGAASAEALGISHQVVDVRREFRDKVLRPVVQAYADGRTPNPCALCNARIKLPLLWQAAREAGCDFLATGHYARLGGPPGARLLREAAHHPKSQAYFLARVSSKLLDKLMFPLGDLSKDQVRALAADMGFEAAERPESQDVCFLPAGGWDELAAGFGAVKPGHLEDRDGNRLGGHRGLHRFTIGQRRGLGVTLGYPAYVLAIDAGRGAVTLGPAEGLWSGGLLAKRVRWYEEPGKDEALNVRIRYAHRGVDCRVAATEGGGLEVAFREPQRAVTPGQLAVFSRGGVIVGSAWIEKALPPAGT